jgi:hypothetical protein
VQIAESTSPFKAGQDWLGEDEGGEEKGRDFALLVSFSLVSLLLLLPWKRFFVRQLKPHRPCLTGTFPIL